MAPSKLVIKVRDSFGHGNDHVHFGHSYPLCLPFLDGFHPADYVWPIRNGEGYREQTCA